MAGLSYSNLSIIIVDDVRATRSILKGLLRNLGVLHFSEAGDGAEALEILRHQGKDLVITDLSMEPMNGIEFTRQLRQPNNLNALVPVLMISAHNEKNRIQEALNAGVSAFLLKPVTPLALGGKIRTLLEQRAPLVKSRTYYGPDRRRRAAWVRKDRRSVSQQSDHLL